MTPGQAFLAIAAVFGVVSLAEHLDTRQNPAEFKGAKKDEPKKLTAKQKAKQYDQRWLFDDPKGIGGYEQHKLFDTRRNVEQGFYDKHGVFHPIRASKDYDENWVEFNREERKFTGENSAEQQLGKQFRRAVEKGQRGDRLEEKIGNLQAERDTLKETLAGDGAAKYTNLLTSIRGKQKGQLEYIPLQKAEELIGRGKRFAKVNIVQRGAHKYVPYEYFLDLLAEQAGYSSDAGLRDGIVRATKYKKRLASLDGEIAETQAEWRRVKGIKAPTRLKPRQAARKKAA